MRTLTVAIAAVVSIALSAQAPAQTREVTDSGVLVTDPSGRAARLEGPDGVVVEYLYDGADAEETSGVTVRVNEKLSLTVRYAGRREVQAAGLPRLTSEFDFEKRTAAVLADEKVVARLEYTADDLFSRISLPRHFTWTCTPAGTQRVRQSVENANGKTIATAVVTTGMSIDGVRNDRGYGVVAEEFGMDLDAVTYEQSPTGALTTARDADERAAFFVVHTARCDVGFAPNGEARFYDLHLSVLGGEIPPGSDVLISKAWEMQRGTIPDHLVLTAHGRIGVFAEEFAKGAIASAWTDSKGRVHAMSAMECNQ
jgi:hypothetical protein